ncbi:MAG TPA: hypothetical protein VIU10_04560 [Candidatus Udaeobacter sp.]
MNTISFATSLAWLLAWALPLLGEVHPAQVQPPRVQQLSQLPPGSSQHTATKEVTNADISAGIKRHISGERRQASDKKFHINYRGKNLALDLVRVHDDRLSSLGGGKYFACVDMKAADGTIYDIDFFMTGQPGGMSVTETSVHKINGKPLYNWKEQGGVWKRVRVS